MQTKIVSSFEGENMQRQYDVLSYTIDLHFHDHMLPIEFDENDQSSNRKKILTVKKKRKEKELCCTFITIDPDKNTLIFLELSMKYLDTSNNKKNKL